MQGFFQTPDPNPNHTVGWETLRGNRRISYEMTVSEKIADAIKHEFFFFGPILIRIGAARAALVSNLLYQAARYTYINYVYITIVINS